MALLGRLAVGVGGFWRDHGDLEAARRWLLLALERRATIEPGLVALALEQVASLDMALGDRLAAERHAREALQLSERLGEPRGVVRAHTLLGELGALSRGPQSAAQAIRELESALAMARKLGDHRVTIHVLGSLGSAHRSDDEASVRYLSEARDLARQVGDVRAEALALSNLGYVSHRLGRTDDALQMAGEAAERFRTIGDERNEAWALLNLATALVAAGRHGEAKTAVLRADHLAEAAGAPPEQIQALEVGAELLEVGGNLRAAVTIRAAVDAIRATRRLDRPNDERAAWERSTERLRKQLGAAAHRGARSEGAALTLPVALASLRSTLDAPATVADRSDPEHDGHAQLTARELDVLRLVGRGLADGEIARELGISPKTASVHVSNIKRKLGLDTRLQVALRAGTDD